MVKYIIHNTRDKNIKLDDPTRALLYYFKVVFDKQYGFTNEDMIEFAKPRSDAMRVYWQDLVNLPIFEFLDE